MSTGPPDNLMKDQQAPRNVSHGHAVSDQAAEILRLYQDEKLKMVAVAARLGLTEWRVWTTLHSMGVPLRPKGRPKGSWNARPLVWLDEARRLYQSGKSLDDVADALGISARKLRYHFQKAGISCRTRGRPPGGRAGQKNAAASKNGKQKDKRK